MSAANEAWQEWSDRTPVKYDAEGPVHFGFMAGYRRALEDAADTTHANGDSWAITENVPPNVRDVVSNVLWGTADWLRVEARAVAPRETKD